MRHLMIFFFFLGTVPLIGQSAHQFLRKADKDYSGADYTAAEEQYRKSLEQEKSVKGHYNLGNAIYQQERFEEAVKHYEEAVGRADDPTIKSNAYHNLGNAYFSNEEFDKSIEAYKNALRLNSKALDTKQNLAQALRMMQQQQEQQKQEQQDQEQNKDEQEQNEDQEQQQNQDQEGNPEDQKEQEQQSQQEQQQEQQEQEAQPQPQEKDLSKEEARKLLQIMENEERKVQEKMKKAKGKKAQTDKDW